MRSIVLAAGRGERLNGVAAAFHKPLLIINGRPLIVDVVQKACSVSDHCTIVCAPANVGAICELVESARVQGSYSYIVQPHPAGPGDAVLRALQTGHRLQETPVMILMADNVLSQRDVDVAAKRTLDGERIVIGTRKVNTKEEAARFTRVHDSGKAVEGPIEDGWSHRVWCGPLVVPEATLMRVLVKHCKDDKELKIGKYLGELGFPFVTFDSDAVDVGVPSEVTHGVG